MQKAFEYKNNIDIYCPAIASTPPPLFNTSSTTNINFNEALNFFQNSQNLFQLSQNLNTKNCSKIINFNEKLNSNNNIKKSLTTAQNLNNNNDILRHILPLTTNSIMLQEQKQIKNELFSFPLQQEQQLASPQLQTQQQQQFPQQDLTEYNLFGMAASPKEQQKLIKQHFSPQQHMIEHQPEASQQQLSPQTQQRQLPHHDLKNEFNLFSFQLQQQLLQHQRSPQLQKSTIDTQQLSEQQLKNKFNLFGLQLQQQQQLSKTPKQLKQLDGFLSAFLENSREKINEKKLDLDNERTNHIFQSIKINNGQNCCVNKENTAEKEDDLTKNQITHNPTHYNIAVAQKNNVMLQPSTDNIFSPSFSQQNSPFNIDLIASAENKDDLQKIFNQEIILNKSMATTIQQQPFSNNYCSSVATTSSEFAGTNNNNNNLLLTTNNNNLLLATTEKKKQQFGNNHCSSTAKTSAALAAVVAAANNDNTNSLLTTTKKQQQEQNSSAFQVVAAAVQKQLNNNTNQQQQFFEQRDKSVQQQMTQLMCLPNFHILNNNTTTSSQCKPIPNNERVDLLRFKLKEPLEWVADDVVAWMLDVARRHSIPCENLTMHKFAKCTGSILMLMTEQNFCDFDPCYGTLLFGEFKKLVLGKSYILKKI